MKFSERKPANPKPQPSPIACPLCGDRGLVYRAYLEPKLPLNNAKELVRCPKCQADKPLPITSFSPGPRIP